METNPSFINELFTGAKIIMNSRNELSTHYMLSILYHLSGQKDTAPGRIKFPGAPFDEFYFRNGLK